MWYEFLRYYPIRFQRQKPLGAYIADFYCAKAQIVVELDVGGHYEDSQKERDERRTADLKQMNLTVIRFCNREIDENFEGVCETIDRVVRAKCPIRSEESLRC